MVLSFFRSLDKSDWPSVICNHTSSQQQRSNQNLSGGRQWVYSSFCHGCNQIASLCLSPPWVSGLNGFAIAEPHRCLVATLPFAACISGFIYEYHLSLTRSLWGSISFSCTLREARVMGVRGRDAKRGREQQWNSPLNSIIHHGVINPILWQNYSFESFCCCCKTHQYGPHCTKCRFLYIPL